MWCEICRKYQPSSEVRGVAAKAARSMIDGCTTVALHSVKRHASSAEHMKAAEREMAQLPSERAPGTPSPAMDQPKVDGVLQSSTKAATRKMMETAYHLAKTPTMPLSQIKVLCSVQEKNGVNLLKCKFLSIFYY